MKSQYKIHDIYISYAACGSSGDEKVHMNLTMSVDLSFHHWYQFNSEVIFFQ
jgi:hypothetical protein